jgi:glc operon protein GlcG
MKTILTGLAAATLALTFAGSASAQLMDKKALSLAESKKILAAAEAEAVKNNWTMACAVVDDAAAMVAYSRIDGTQIASTEIAVRKAKSAMMFKRPTKVFEERMAAGPAGSNLPTLHPLAVASEGGVPITYQNQIIGAIGCSGGTSQQDGTVATAGVAAATK